ncbi:RkpR, polysaccharide export protein [Stappia sp. BW2]|uniref:RkpR, polysaccharide export protein n=1 Tax=Stappia sp. BW2 TaxID=2592622 RepID=UPI0013968C0C|nr:RkpR, polysaccharide export protein [Stappia sp. BW2]
MSAVGKVSEKDGIDTSKGAVFNLPSKKKGGGVAKSRIKEGGLVTRLKKSGLDPQKLLDLALPGSTAKSVTKRRHRMIVLGFLFFVAVPATVFSVYMFFWASDQYHSKTAFSVRSSNPVAATEILGMVMGGASESTSSDSYILTDYLRSQAVLKDLPQTLDLQAIFNREPSDFLFSMGKDLPVEDRLNYWNDMVDVSFDATSGVIQVEVRTFRPEDSVEISKAILKLSEGLVNELSEANRRETVRFAEESVAKAEARLKAIRKQMLTYRNETQEVSPEENAKLATEMIAGLDQQRASREAEKKTLMSYLDEDSPRIRLLNQQIEALEGQISSARKRLGSGVSPQGDPDNVSRKALSFRLADYSDLALEEEFAQQLYVTSLASLEKARQEADSKHLYLATFIEPTLSEDAQYPSRILYSLAAFLLLAGIWSVVVLMYYNVRDRT